MSIFTKKSAVIIEEEKLPSRTELNESFLAAVDKANLEQITQLYAQGADINYQDKSGNTALHHTGFMPVIKFLIETADADTSIRNNYGTTAEEGANSGIAAYLQQAHERQKPTGWIKVTDDTVAHVVFSESLNYRLTEVFNFSARTYVHIAQNLETRAENKSFTIFNEFQNKPYLQQALQELQNQGGTAEADSIDGKQHLTKDSFGTRR